MMKIYFMNRDKTFYRKYTKEEIYSLIDNLNPDTFLPFLEEMNYPYIEDEWNRTLKVAQERGMDKVFGRYIAKMRLCSFRNFTYSDSKRLNEKEETF